MISVVTMSGTEASKIQLAEFREAFDEFDKVRHLLKVHFLPFMSLQFIVSLTIQHTFNLPPEVHQAFLSIKIPVQEYSTSNSRKFHFK